MNHCYFVCNLIRRAVFFLGQLLYKILTHLGRAALPKKEKRVFTYPRTYVDWRKIVTRSVQNKYLPNQLGKVRSVDQFCALN